jgi:hypothetical protein
MVQAHIVCVVQAAEVGQIPVKIFYAAASEGIPSAVEAVKRMVGADDAVVATGSTLSEDTAAALGLIDGAVRLL